MNKPVPCKLRAGDVIKCQAVADRMSDEAGAGTISSAVMIVSKGNSLPPLIETDAECDQPPQSTTKPDTRQRNPATMAIRPA